MINLHNAIFALNPSVVTIRGDVAYDSNEQEVAYDMSAAQAKLAELQIAETSAQAAEVAAKTSALSKLSALGLTDAEIKALTGTT
jgi:hypothetical protein